MTFKLPQKSMTSGTSAHSSALKMKTESALKAKNPKAKTYDEAYIENLDYQPNEGEGVTRTENYGKVDKWGRKYEGSNVPGTAYSEEEAYEYNTGEDDVDDFVEAGDRKQPKIDRESNERGKAKFKKAAKAWNMKTYGTENPTSAANKGGMTKKELAAKHKASQTTPEVKKAPEVAVVKEKKKGKLSSFVGKVFKKASPDKIAQRKTDKAEAKKQGVSVWQLKKNRKK